jgi:hypothetical protein
VILPAPAAGTVAVKFADHRAIFAASVTESSLPPGWIEYAAPDASCEVNPAVA